MTAIVTWNIQNGKGCDGAVDTHEQAPIAPPETSPGPSEEPGATPGPETGETPSSGGMAIE